MGIEAVLSVQMMVIGILLSQMPCEGLKIAAFNIQQLGVKKITDESFATPLINV